jgi:hypothetical protein
MVDEIAPVVESSPATSSSQGDNAPVSIPTDGEGYAEWRSTGKLPEPKSPAPKSVKSKTEASATSDAHKEETSEGDDKPETAPKSEAGKESKQEPSKHKGAEDRIKQLLARVKELEGKQSSQPEKTEKAESSAAKAEEKKAETPKAETAKPRPKLEDFEDWDAWQKADADWMQERIDAKAGEMTKKALEEWETKQTQREQQKALEAKITSARERYPDLDEGFIPAVNAIFDDKSIVPVIKAAIQESDVDIDLLYVMGKKTEDLADFVKVAKSNPREALRRVFEVERLVKEELAKAKGKASGESETARSADGKFASAEDDTTDEVPAKQKPKVPPPSRELGGRTSPPGDADEAALRALEAGDASAFRRFRDERNSRDIGKSHR